MIMIHGTGKWLLVIYAKLMQYIFFIIFCIIQFKFSFYMKLFMAIVIPNNLPHYESFSILHWQFLDNHITITLLINQRYISESSDIKTIVSISNHTHHCIYNTSY